MLISKVKGHEGRCFCTWKNTNQLDNRVDGGITGFFSLYRNPFKEFHGMFFKDTKTGKTVILSTEGKYS